jgi:hypothetical protein
MIPLVVFLLLCIGVAWLGRRQRLGFLGTFLVSVIVSPMVAILSLLLGDAVRTPANDQTKR